MTGFLNSYFVVCSPVPNFEPALTKAQGKKEFCITLSESKSRISFDKWMAREIPWREILKNIPDGVGILIVKEQGGAYLAPEKVSSLKSAV